MDIQVDTMKWKGREYSILLRPKVGLDGIGLQLAQYWNTPIPIIPTASLSLVAAPR